MALPTSIKNILNPNIVESARIDFKEGWNPESIMHTICAFANDIDNFSGGYIIIGVEDNNGQPKFPIKGLEVNEIEKIQKEIIEYCKKCIEPSYIPAIEVLDYNDAKIIALWVHAGADRPYKSRINVYGKNNPSKAHYIRKGSTTILATPNDEKELFSLSGLQPFDDRPNYNAKLDDLDKDLISKFLNDTGSSMHNNISNLNLQELAENMRIIEGPPENCKPKNVGLLFFSYNPEKYFPYAYIDLVNIPDPTGEGMIEKTFKGPLHIQFKDVMLYLQNNVIQEKVFKVTGQAEAERFFNYPFQALEELIANAILHKDYRTHEPISVRINKESIEITSIPGIDSTIKKEDILNLNLRSRRYRNRRISDFLKELKIVEAKNTGFPTILKYVRHNKSPLPIIQTDDERSYVTVILPIHEVFNCKPLNLQEKIVKVLEENDSTMTEISSSLGYKSIPGALKKALDKLIKDKLIYVKNKKYSLFNNKLKD